MTTCTTCDEAIQGEVFRDTDNLPFCRDCYADLVRQWKQLNEED